MEIRRSARGSIVVLALWSFALLAAFAVSLGYMVRQKVTFLDRMQKRQNLWQTAWSGVEQARAMVKEDTDTEVDTYLDDWAHSPQRFRDIDFGSSTLSMGYWRPVSGKMSFWSGLCDEQSKLNLNFADPPAVSLLLQQVAGLSQESADPVAFAIIDWRDGDSAYGHPDFGAEDQDYSGLPLPYEAKDKPYESLDELLLVKGMNRDIFEKIKPFITVFGSGIVNLNTAGREVLISLGLPLSAADKLIRHRDGLDGVSGSGDDKTFANISTAVSEIDREEPPLDDVERTALENLVGSGKVGLNTAVFGLISRAQTKDGRYELEMEAIINREASVLFCRPLGYRWRSR